MAASRAGSFIEVSFTNEEQVAMLKTVLQYEAAVRGLTIGQAFADIVLSTVDEDRYPAEMIECLREITEDAKTQAVSEDISSVALPKSA